MLKRLTESEIIEIAERVGWFSLTNAEATEYVALSCAVLETLDTVDDFDLDQHKIQGGGLEGVAWPEIIRSAGRRPSADEDPLNAIVRWIDVRRAKSGGPLAGMRLVVKDSIAVAGVPMTLGSAVLRGFTPSVDSVVVERLILAGAEIVAVTNMDDFAFSGGGDTSAYGPIGNPFDPSRSAGGSSGGSAAALSYDATIDGAIGTDQGGSIRLPASWCGVLGLKPTHSLVPYTGIAGIDATFDHVGPMARSTSVLGQILMVIAGQDSSDPRQARVRYDSSDLELALESSEKSFEGVRIGVLIEGFSDDDDPRARTSEAIRGTVQRLSDAGAIVEEVSIPEHLQGGGIAFAGFIEGMASTALGGGNGYHWAGRYSPDFAVAMAAGLRTRGGELAPQLKLVSLLGEHLRRNYGGSVYAAAQNQRPWLREAYDAALRKYDVLLLPTAPYTAFEHDSSMSITEKVLRGWEPLRNCVPFDMTGHPAITLPVASVDGLPVGVMLVGRQFDDARLIDIAGRYERRFGWESLTPSGMAPSIPKLP